MTDKRDEMPDELYIGNYDVEVSWVATANRLHADDIKYIRADLSPPVPDDVAEIDAAIEHFEEKYIPSLSKKSKRLLKVLINAAKARQNYQDLWIAESKAHRAASAPSAEVRALRDALALIVKRAHDSDSAAFTRVAHMLYTAREALASLDAVLAEVKS